MKANEFEIQKLTKYCNEILILGLLKSGEKHGYQLALEIEELSDGFFKFNHGTLYPILHKLEEEAYIKGIWPEEETKRKRKFYIITEKGKKYLESNKAGWEKLFKYLFRITGE